MVDHKVSSATVGNRVIISVLGRDKVGIIASVSGILAQTGVNILDISQTILQDIFTMVMVCDIKNSTVNFDVLKENLEAKGLELGVQVQVQHEDVFQFMHRI
ncbi:MAG: ACT domain-containing protein [Thermincola sp.]|jgi:ACT domain-containing protein|nr:ACT domain-containing protein [Thermincola sp.]MDT3704057.1 ACT domain-containing protein [Thermincola sp.]